MKSNKTMLAKKSINPRTRTTLPGVPATLGETFDFLRLIWSVANALETRSLLMQRTLGISGPQRLVLRLVGQMPGISPNPLASLLYLHPSTLSIQLKRLQKKGLLARVKDPSDSRRVFLYLTKTGRGFTAPEPVTIEAKVDELLRLWSARELKTAKRVLAEFAERIRAS